MTILNFYKGFEGEPELTILQVAKNENTKLYLKIWMGYFDEIIERIKPNEKGYWEGITLD